MCGGEEGRCHLGVPPCRRFLVKGQLGGSLGWFRDLSGPHSGEQSPPLLSVWSTAIWGGGQSFIPSGPRSPSHEAKGLDQTSF